MLCVLNSFLAPEFLPHVFCYRWDSGLVYLHAISDSLIFLAYFTIPFGLAYLVRKRKDIPFNWIFLAFACFIVFCGLTHAMEVWTLWHPDYWLAGIIKALTAVASIATAIALLPIIPKAISIPSPTQLLVANEALRVQQESLRDLSGRLLTIQDDERRHIARELHDSMGQQLVAIKMLLQSGMVRRQSGSDATRALEEAVESCDVAMQQMRTLSHLLYPPLLDELGLAAALNWYVSGLRERSALDVRFQMTHADELKLPPEIERAIFRIVQECLTNVLRHSGSPLATVHLVRSTNDIAVRVTDQGKGIPAQERAKIVAGGTIGVGLRGMRERVGQLGGTLDIQSNPAGTTITARFPLPHNLASAGAHA
jgi:signal transduction histidine kinase